MKTHQLLMNFKSGLFGSVLLLVLIPIATFGQTVSIEAGTDRMGGDYKNFELASPQPELCQQACANDPACKAYTYVKPGVQGRRAVCFLKSSVSPPTANECCTSGARAAGGRPGPIVIRPLPIIVQPVPSGGRPRPIVVRPGPPTPPDPGGAFVIPAPSTATVVSNFDDKVIYEFRWTWNTIPCFPQGAGEVPKPCPWVNDIEGFKIYSMEGGLVTSIKNPSARDLTIGKQPAKCYFVTAFKGDDESALSPVGCVDAPAKPLYQISTAIQTPGNLRLAKNAAECAAGNVVLALLCDAIIKSNAQVLRWEHSGSSIDGFRLYDAYKGTPFVIKTEANRDIRLFTVQPSTGGGISDYCFTVRAYKGDTESLPSNPVCLTPLGPAPAPFKPLLLIGPSRGVSIVGRSLLRNQNAGCLFPQKYNEIRTRSPWTDIMSIFWIHRDTNILCGHRTVTWSEGGIEFPLDAIPADFKSVELRFTSNGSVARQGTEGGFLGVFGNKSTFNVNCIQSIRAYNYAIRDNTYRESYKIGDDGAWFSWDPKELVATETLPNTTHRFNVTAIVKRSLAAREKKLGFVWEVNKDLVGNNDMCATSFEGFALEVTLKP